MRRRRLAVVAAVPLLGLLVGWDVVATTVHPQQRAVTAAAPDPDATRGLDAARDPDAGADPDGGGRSESDTISGALNWYYNQRAYPGRTIPKGALAAAQAQAARVPTDTAGAKTAPAWQSIGPQPIDTSNTSYDGGVPAAAGFGDSAGRLTSIAVVPGSDQIAYVGAADGGVWKTTDGGTTWLPVSDGLPSEAIGAVAVSATNPSVVWAGTGEANFSGDAYYGAGIYRSTDAGATWHKRGGTTLDNTEISRIALTPKYVLAATYNGLYRTTDGGTTWTPVLQPGGTTDYRGNRVTDVQVIPGTKNQRVLAAVGNDFSDAQNGLWLSTDSGVTFTKLAPTGFAAQAKIGRIALAVSGKTVYAVVGDGSGSANALAGVYRSTTGPTGTWTLVATSAALSDSNSALAHCMGGQPGAQAWYDEYVAIDPGNPSHVVLGLEEVYQTTDGGATWHTVGRYADYCSGGSPTTHPDQHAGAFAVAGGATTFFTVNDGGVWKQAGATLDNDHWVNLNSTLSVTQPYYVAASAGASPVIVAGTQDNGTLMLGNTAANWQAIHGGDGADVAIDPAHPTTMYAEYPYEAMYRTSNGGVSWSSIQPPDGANGTAQFIAPFELDPTDATHLVAVGQHVYDSHSTGNPVWTMAYDNGSGHQGTALAVQGATTYEAWCGGCNPTNIGSDAGFGRGLATNQGGTWHAAAASGLPNRFVTGILIDPANSAHVYVTVSGYRSRSIPTSGSGHVFESLDGGASFTDISANLPDAPANDVVTVGRTLVVATDVGVFKRSSTGTWARYGTGMPMISVLDLTVPAGTTKLIAASHGRGIWTLTP